MDSIRAHLRCKRRHVLFGLGHSGFYILLWPFLIVADTPICLPLAHSLFCPFWWHCTGLSVCLGQKVDFLDFFASRNGPMIMFWSVKWKQKSSGRDTVFLIKKPACSSCSFLVPFMPRIWTQCLEVQQLSCDEDWSYFWRILETLTSVSFCANPQQSS